MSGLILLPLLLNVMVSCSETDDGLNPSSHSNEYVEFSFNLPEHTRASDMTDADVFREGDRIGLFIGKSSVPKVLTYTGGKWHPLLKRSEVDSAAVLNAFYPYSDKIAAEAGGCSCTLRENQCDLPSGYAGSDILWSFNSDFGTDGVVQMKFKHIMHQLNIVLKSSSPLPEDIKVEVRTSLCCGISLHSGSISNVGNMQWVKARNRGAGQFSAIVAPQSLADFSDDEGWIRITTGGISRIFKAPRSIAGEPSLLSGGRTGVTLRLKSEEKPQDDIITDWRNKKVWVYGVTAPVYEESEAVRLPMGSTKFQTARWTDYGTKDEVFARQLAWYEGCGWYDCNKTYMKDNDKDERMCWAGSSSNLLHWWINMNKEYVKAYDEKYGNTPYYKQFPRPSSDFSSKWKSRIFQNFVDNFKDKGAWEGMSWFIGGVFGGTSGCTNKEYRENFKGYFKEVFNRDNISGLFETVSVMGKQRFNETIKRAINEKKGISIDVNGNHAMTMWGAEFDENGYISHIYYVDNNWGDQDDDFQGGGSCLRKEIRYKEHMNIADQTFIGKNTTIVKVGLVDLRRDVWKKAFPDVKPSK